MIQTFNKILSDEDINLIVSNPIVNDNIYRYDRYGECFCICLIKFNIFDKSIYEEFEKNIRHIDKILFVGQNFVIVLLANTNESKAYQAMNKFESIFNNNNNLMSLIIEKREENLSELIILINNKSVFLEKNHDYKNIFIIGGDI